MPEKKLTYKEAFAELEEILLKLENSELNVDELGDNVKRAAQLIKLCRGKLFETEAEIEKVLEDIDDKDK